MRETGGIQRDCVRNKRKIEGVCETRKGRGCVRDREREKRLNVRNLKHGADIKARSTDLAGTRKGSPGGDGLNNAVTSTQLSASQHN